MPTFILAAIGALFGLRYLWSWLRLLAELTIVPGMSVSEPTTHPLTAAL